MGGINFYYCNTCKYVFLDNSGSSLIYPTQITITPIRAVDKSSLEVALVSFGIKIMARSESRLA